uniref:Secreted protein n=1 Tax=Achlya hypogyna TaxID=1202772 RepID=A0A0A7CPJ4_ACHHY|nr:secreted protein [Achlya hypogyna]
MRKCKSPYLLSLVAVASSCSNAVLAVEFMDGGDLRGYLDKKQRGETLSVEYSALEVAWVIANALADLHHDGLLHRDLKSHNVLLSSTSYIKVADLGLARNDATTMTKGVGTLYWMAPEVQAFGAKYDESADIYSFGVILTELNTLQLPYADVKMTPWLVMAEVTAGKLRPSLRADCPAWLRELATACMANDPTQRPTARTIVRMLQRQCRRLREDPLAAQPTATTTLVKANADLSGTLNASTASTAVLSGGSTQFNSALSTASLVVPTINCSGCKAPQSLLSTLCSACAAPTKSAILKLKVLRARLAMAKEHGVDISVPCFACSAPKDAAVDICGECKFTSAASDDDHLRLLVAFFEHASGNEVSIDLVSLVAKEAP